MLCRITLGYKCRVTQEQHKQLELLLHEKVETKEIPEKPGLLAISNAWQQYEADPQALMDIGVFGFEVQERIDRPVVEAMSKIQRSLDRLEATLSQTPLPFTQHVFKDEAPVPAFNAKCDVHVPGLGLLVLNEVLVLEDCCTEELQRTLDDGWRIVAACPQPNSRRPDYVVGRYNPAK